MVPVSTVHRARGPANASGTLRLDRGGPFFMRLRSPVAKTDRVCTIIRVDRRGLGICRPASHGKSPYGSRAPEGPGRGNRANAVHFGYERHGNGQRACILWPRWLLTQDIGWGDMRSGPISRVLSRTVIYLGAHVAMRLLARYPSAGRAGPWRSASRLRRRGFTKPPRHHGAGGRLHHRFSFSLYAEAQVGVFFSAALIRRVAPPGR